LGWRTELNPEIAQLPGIADTFAGRACTDVVRFDVASWSFEFGGQATLHVHCPWRILANGKVVLGNTDHGQQFGTPEAVDGIAAAKRLLARPVVDVTIAEQTADLVLHLEGDIFLEVFNSSSGYEGWECSSSNGLLAIGAAGGELQVYYTHATLS
jgi:hypothetical protein